MVRNLCVSIALAVLVSPLSASAESHWKLAFLALADDHWQVWVMEEGEEEARQVTQSPGDKVRASWFPGGQRLLVAALEGDALVVDLVTGEQRKAELDGAPCFDAVVSPGGSTVACSRPLSTEEPYNHAIWLVNLESGVARQLTFRPGMEHEPAWDFRGQWIYYAAGSGGPTHDLWRVSPDGLRRERLSAGPRYWLDPSVAADGSLGYASNQTGGDYEIWLRRPGAAPERLTAHPGLDAHPSFSPDGRQVVFERFGGDGPELWLWDLEEGKGGPLPGGQGGRRPAWFEPEASGP